MGILCSICDLTKSILGQCAWNCGCVLPLWSNLVLQWMPWTALSYYFMEYCTVFCVNLSTGIRYPEELSFCKPLSSDDLKQNYSEKQMKKKSSTTTVKNGTPADTNSFIANRSHNTSNGSLERSQHHPHSPGRTPISSPVTCLFNVVEEKVYNLTHKHIGRIHIIS